MDLGPLVQRISKTPVSKDFMGTAPMFVLAVGNTSGHWLGLRYSRTNLVMSLASWTDRLWAT